jgi:8-oxo-dGTP pyrophosphatase MutT (NUDIX family)
VGSERELLKQLIREVLVGYGNKEYGKDGVAGNLHPQGIAAGDAGVRSNTNVLDDEANEEQQVKQSTMQAACCFIRSDDGMILAVSRKDDPTQWGFPGGKVDAGEDAETAAARELQEETGLVATRLTQIFSMQDGDGYVTTTFACEVEGEINTSESGVIKWVHPNILTNPNSSPFVDYNLAIFKKLGIKS